MGLVIAQESRGSTRDHRGNWVTRNRFVVQIWTSAGNTMGLEREARKKREPDGRVANEEIELILADFEL